MSFDAGWYPVALSEGLEPGTSAGTRLFGKELVIWRDASGVAHAWEDRCPHRGMRLSFGFVRGDRIACLYHGWQYDAGGRCRYIPAHPDLTVPETIRTTAYASCERLGMVWVHSELGRDSVPDLVFEDRPVTPVRSIYVACRPGELLRRLEAGEIPTPPVAAPAHSAVKRSGSLLALTLGSGELLAAIQPCDAEQTALHLAVAGRAQDWRGAGQKKIALWAQELRRDLEQHAAAAIVAPQPAHATVP
jgi:nitrite reductase/ring-hydroxylating ferredoxin subunit